MYELTLKKSDTYSLLTRLTGREVIFLIAVTLKMMVEFSTFTVVPHMLGNDIMSPLFKIFSYSSYLLAVLSLFIIPKLTSKEIIRIIILLLITAAGSYFSGNEIFLTLIFIYGAKDLDLEKIFKITARLYILFFIITVLASLTGIIENWDFLRDAQRPRWGLGFIWPSYTSSVLLLSTLIICYLKKDRLNLVWVAVLEAVNIWIFTYTDSRAGMAITAIVPVIFYLLKLKRKSLVPGKAEQVIKWAFPVFAILILLCIVLYDGTGVLDKLNHALSSRLSYGQDAIKEYGIHLFGQKIEWVGWGGIGHMVSRISGEYNFVDIAYLKLLLENGVLVWLAIMAAWTCTSLRAYKMGNRYLIWVLFFIALYCTVEQWLMNIGMNPFLIFTACLLYKNKSGKEVKES